MFGRGSGNAPSLLRILLRVPKKHGRARHTPVVAEPQPAISRIEAFTGPYFFLSNFSHSPVEFEGEVYPTVEHAYAAAKTQDPNERERIRFAITPGEAKRIGRQVALRSGWDDVRVDVMRGLLAKKFVVDSDLALKLQATGDAELLEGNTWGDRFWGVCGGQGRNQLGQLLMERRELLRRGCCQP